MSSFGTDSGRGHCGQVVKREVVCRCVGHGLRRTGRTARATHTAQMQISVTHRTSGFYAVERLPAQISLHATCRKQVSDLRANSDHLRLVGT
jgi:hypothetical protein